MNRIFNLIIGILIITELIFIVLWIKENNSGNESIFTFINSLLIPLAIIVKAKYKKNSELKVNLEVIIDFCKIKFLNESGIYYAQTNLKFKSYNDKITIEKIILNSKLSNGLEGSPYSNDGFKIEALYQYQDIDLLILNPEKFLKEKSKLKEKAINVNNIVIEPNSLKLFSIIGILESERLSDGYDDFEISGWRLEVFFNGNQSLIVEIPWEIHSQSEKIPIKYRFIGFNLSK